ncbi:hypothetical protein SEA_WEASELS2_254 [Rhodococcus phage Weasels2]|uniref:Uncharacterized protein n=1 Tax=Rhodococcus phage Weasels2 TaxID=1897437 RepID=A0A1I9SAM6_9CAUD|nr:hypothetical protein FDH04_gp162 [Rhodococcus phage Weasels2]AOZ63832.1 hypothetical protein SEA_WEASELS2_254 [Rhodococcus phage Weasels2]
MTLLIYILIGLVVWFICARGYHALEGNNPDKAVENIILGFGLALIWPLTVTLFVLYVLFNKVMPVVFRMNK